MPTPPDDEDRGPDDDGDGEAHDIFDEEMVWGTDPSPADRRTKRIALWGVAIAIVIVVVTILLVRLVDTGSPPPDGPSAAAARWLADLVDGTTHDRPSQCAGQGRTDYLLAVKGDHPRVRVRDEQRTAPRQWTVHLTLDPPRQVVSVFVQRHGTRYLVC